MRVSPSWKQTITFADQEMVNRLVKRKHFLKDLELLIDGKRINRFSAWNPIEVSVMIFAETVIQTTGPEYPDYNLISAI